MVLSCTNMNKMEPDEMFGAFFIVIGWINNERNCWNESFTSYNQYLLETFNFILFCGQMELQSLKLRSI